MAIYQSILDTIGNTPVVKLHRIAPKHVDLYVKIEAFNPAGSVKDRLGGLLRYGIPDFKMEKSHIDRRVKQLEAEGVTVRAGVLVGAMPEGSKVTNWAKETISPAQLQKAFDAILLAGGSEQSRDLPVPGRELEGIHFAMEFLPQQNKVNAGDKLKGQLRADGKHVIVIGGGDTGSDCVGTSNRHGAASVTQFEVMPQPPAEENRPLTWPYWPLKLADRHHNLQTMAAVRADKRRRIARETLARLPR